MESWLVLDCERNSGGSVKKLWSSGRGRVPLEAVWLDGVGCVSCVTCHFRP